MSKMTNLQDADQQQIVVFSLDEPRYALFLSSVERVLRAVEITRLPFPLDPGWIDRGR